MDKDKRLSEDQKDLYKIIITNMEKRSANKTLLTKVLSKWNTGPVEYLIN